MNYIAASAKLGKNVRVGRFSVIEDNVIIGDDTVIGNGVTIYAGTIIGNSCYIGNNCTIGKQPRPAKTSTVKVNGLLAPAELGSGVTMGECAVIYAGTKIGDNTLIADLASVRENCVIGNYVIIGRGVAVENQVSIGDNTKIQTGAYVTAYSTLEDNVFIAPMVTTTNDNYMGRTDERFKYIKGATVKRGARVGGGAILLPGITVGEETFVAAGALVTKDTEEKQVYKGFPARKIRAVSDEELLSKGSRTENEGSDN